MQGIPGNPHCSEFLSLAAQEEAKVASVIPSDENNRFVLFTEAARAMDYWTVVQSFSPAESRLHLADFQIMQWGWNKTVAHLLSPLKTPGAFPITTSTDQGRSFAMNFLHQLGRSVLMRRAADMIRFGLMKAETSNSGFIVRKTDPDSSQFLDNLEFSHWKTLEQRIYQGNERFYNRWELLGLDKINHVKNRPGNFILQDKRDFKRWQRKDIDSLMMPLIRPWDSGFGIMMAYEARPEVDYHFMAAASELLWDYRNDAGFHPDTQFGDATGDEIMMVATMLVALHIKHVRFALLATKHYPTISLPLSLTIWSPLESLEQSIADFSEMEHSRVRKVLDLVTMKAREAAFLRERSTPFMPLLINLENGFVLRPISSLGSNPLLSVTTLLEWRDPAAANVLSQPREGWLRSDIYALFQGNRFVCVEGSFKARGGNQVFTDIDAAIFDIVTGELALIQVKWQDYHTNDVRKLRSKASNLARELDEWANAVGAWIEYQGKAGILNSLRISINQYRPITNIYLFAICRDAARTKGYGFSASHPSLALANWPQFQRVRFDLGPEKRVFHDMHCILMTEMEKKVERAPIPVEVMVAGKTIKFEDLWGAVDEDTAFN